jgi:acyl-coenzyme A thioesterase PaaI-like protein
VHGGVVSLLFDQIMGHHHVTVGVPGMTGTLRVRYRRPTPLFTELRFEVRTGKLRGRKITTLGQLRAGDELTAEAEGLFIMPREGLPRYVRQIHADSG